MKARLLRLATRYGGGFYWRVPGYPNGAKLLPASRTPRDWGAGFWWPARDDRGDMVRGVDLDRHRDLAVAAVLALLGEHP